MHHWKRTVLPLGGAVLVIAVLMLVSRDGETEIERLAALLEIRPGDTVADVGAGDGWLSVEFATVVGETGHVFATELSVRRRDDIRESVAVAVRKPLRVALKPGILGERHRQGHAPTLFHSQLAPGLLRTPWDEL